MTTGPMEYYLALQYVDLRDDDTGKVLYRRAKQQAKYRLTGQIYDLDWNVMYQYLGKRHGDDYDNGRDVKMGGLGLWNAGLPYPVALHLIVRGKVANLFDKDYETAYGYQSAGWEYTSSSSRTF